MHLNTYGTGGRWAVTVALVHLIDAKMRTLNWRPSDLAAASGVPKQTISAILNQRIKEPPELPTLAPLAKALGIPLADLIEAAGYSVGAQSEDSEVLRLARLLRAVPWMASGVERMLELSPEDLDDLLRYMEFRVSQKRRTTPN